MSTAKCSGHSELISLSNLVDAIIFLAPISGFDQVLTEDRTVNRLVRHHPETALLPFFKIRQLQEDSVLLWKAVCSNKLLANVDLVLFLNKCDILDAKLRSGIRSAAGYIAQSAPFLMWKYFGGT